MFICVCIYIYIYGTSSFVSCTDTMKGGPDICHCLPFPRAPVGLFPTERSEAYSERSDEVHDCKLHNTHTHTHTLKIVYNSPTLKTERNTR